MSTKLIKEFTDRKNINAYLALEQILEENKIELNKVVEIIESYLVSSTKNKKIVLTKSTRTRASFETRYAEYKNFFEKSKKKSMSVPSLAFELNLSYGQVHVWMLNNAAKTKELKYDKDSRICYWNCEPLNLNLPSVTDATHELQST